MFRLKDPITVLVQSMVAGPFGKLKPGQIIELEDCSYVRVMIKSGTVSLIDPPTLDPEFLEKAGYELQEGCSYPEKPKEPEKVEEKPVVKAPEPEVFLTRVPKKAKVSEAVVEPVVTEPVKSEPIAAEEKSVSEEGPDGGLSPADLN